MSHQHDETAAVFIQQDRLGFEREATEDEVRAVISEFLLELTRELKSNGCTIIGHLKGTVDAQENGQLFFSVTTFTGKIRFQGEIHGRIAHAKLAINLIVYGVTERQLKCIYENAAGRIQDLTRMALP